MAIFLRTLPLHALLIFRVEFIMASVITFRFDPPGQGIEYTMDQRREILRQARSLSMRVSVMTGDLIGANVRRRPFRDPERRIVIRNSATLKGLLHRLTISSHLPSLGDDHSIPSSAI